MKKDFYTIKEACVFLSENLSETFTTFDILFSMSKHHIKPCFYHSGFIGVEEWDCVFDVPLDKRIPFDGVLQIQSISNIQEVQEKNRIFVVSVEPIYWVRHENKKSRLTDELLKFEEPEIFMVDHSNLIFSKYVTIDLLILPKDSLLKLLQIFKNQAVIDLDGKSDFKNKPLHSTERETLLIIIAALAKEANIDIDKTSKAGVLIANMTHLIGVPIGATTIETHLNKIKQALENRAK